MTAPIMSIHMPKRLHRWMTCATLLVAIPAIVPLATTPLGAQQTARERELERQRRERERERERLAREREARDRADRDDSQYRSRVDTTIAFNKGGIIDLSLMSGEIIVTGWTRNEARIKAYSE